MKAYLIAVAMLAASGIAHADTSSISNARLRYCEELRLGVLRYASIPYLPAKIVALDEEIRTRSDLTEAERELEFDALDIALKNAKVQPPLFAPMLLSVITFDKCLYGRK